MKKFIFFVSVTFLCLQFVNINVFGQEFSSEWQKVPLTFKGSDFDSIYSILSKSAVLQEKGEFETTTEYNKRKNNLSKINLGTGTTAESQLVFVSRPEILFGSASEYLNGFESEYNADNLTLQIKLLNDPVVAAQAFRLSRESNEEQFSINETLFLSFKPANIQVVGKSAVKGASGATSVIKKQLLTRYVLAISNNMDFPGAASRSDFNIDIKLPLEAARNAKGNLAFLYLGKLAQPFYYLGANLGDATNPTISNSSETHSRTQILFFSLDEIWVFNKLTGEIYTKVKPTAK